MGLYVDHSTTKSTLYMKYFLTKDLDGGPYYESFAYTIIVRTLLYLDDIIVLTLITVWAKLQGSPFVPNVIMNQASSWLAGTCLERTVRDWLSLQPVIWILTRILMRIFLGSTITKSTMTLFVWKSELDLWSMLLDALCYGIPRFNQRQLLSLFSQRCLLFQIVSDISFS